MRTYSVHTEGIIAPIRGLSVMDRMKLSLSEHDNFIADIYQLSYAGTIGFPSRAAQEEFPRRIPERKKLDGLCKWEFAATDFTAHVLTALWPLERIEATPDAKQFLEYLILSGAQQDQNASNSAKYFVWSEMNRRRKDGGLSPLEFPHELNSTLQLNDTLPLNYYQRIVGKNLQASEGYALFMEPGTGKTPIIISEIDNLAINSDKCIKALIVCPKNVRFNWELEFKKFSIVPGVVTVLRGDKLNQTKLFLDAMMVTTDPENKYSVVVIAYDSMTKLVDALRAIQWDLCALDESHYIKSPETQRCKAALKLRDSCARRRVLTGTPVANTILDIYSQLEFLGNGWSGFKSWKNFKEFYGVYYTNTQGRRRLVDIQNLPFMQERLARTAFLITKEQALPDLPPKTYDVLEVEMSPEQSEIYRKVAEELYYSAERQLDGIDNSPNRALVINNILTQMLRLAQITSGFVTYDKICDDAGNTVEPQSIDRIDPNPKIETLIESLKEREENSKTIIWCCWRQDIKTISARLRLEGIDHVTFDGSTKDDARIEAERRFNHDNNCTVFVGNAAAGGTGLNLLGYPPGQDNNYNTNCDWVIYFSQNWSQICRTQSEDRTYRKGTRVHIRVSDLCVPNSIDEEIRARVLNKRNLAATVQNIREILRKAIG